MHGVRLAVPMCTSSPHRRTPGEPGHQDVHGGRYREDSGSCRSVGVALATVIRPCSRTGHVSALFA